MTEALGAVGILSLTYDTVMTKEAASLLIFATAWGALGYPRATTMMTPAGEQALGDAAAS
ncbi:MAG: hypothetical protein JWP75_2238 [Frondihabitans sp.]|nr:hypothetical protein [Frondihabitans sp.]